VHIDLTGASPVTVFGAVLPLGPGTYGIESGSLVTSVGGSWTADYQWDFAVEAVQAVPEPSAMLLLGSGLIGLVAYGRKEFFKN
jgi:hypothetical protein